MIRFGVETEQELNKKRHVGPTFNKKKIKTKNMFLDRETARR